MPSCLLAVLACSFQVSGCLCVLTSPHCPGPRSGDGVSCQDAGMDRVADRGRVVAQAEGVLGRARNSSALARKAAASSGPEGRVWAPDLATSGGR